jgi:hypothetical protein
MCHGSDGRGDNKLGRSYGVPDFTTRAFQRSRTDAMLVESILRGIKDTRMKPFMERLNVWDVQDLVPLIRSFAAATGPLDEASVARVSALKARDSEAEALLNVARHAYKIGERARAFNALRAAQALGWNDLDLVNALGPDDTAAPAPPEWLPEHRISHADDVSEG